MNYFFIILEICVLSTLWYLYLHKKTKISIKYLYSDNIAVIIPVSLFSFYFIKYNLLEIYILSIIIVPLILGLSFIYTMIRFWRTPKRKVVAKKNEIVSPADGNVIYIKKIEKNDLPVVVKDKSISKLKELTKTDLIKEPCILIGINMTPFDVHKNCSPINGKVVFYKHTPGKYLSLKTSDSETDNERATYIIKNDNYQVGVVQIASKLVRRIDSYVKVGDILKKGDWIGMIRFGSQVDIILPDYFDIKVSLGQQVYAQKTVIASYY